MSTREQAYNILENLSEEKLQAFITLFGDGTADIIPAKPARKSAASLCGIFHDVADPSLRALEKDAWEQAAAEKFLGRTEEDDI